ncbi:rhomboid family intramembrane serine protease [Pontibacter roseus]|uniref:rhomboid family intramembrane serine protease n=1 Tax=Pontibacter roseus TaxID=336989 RepID=UPI000376F2F8|nr:rhomboid family intramembrane serine protease [Pontibacter roseus]
MNSFWAFFVPQRHYFITPILINLNLLVFVALALTGVHVLSPEGEDLVAAGANFGPYTLTGEWWRLFSSMFLHIGLIHLLVNMYALASIGGVLEPLVGRKQFTMAYILCGLAGSLASLWWDQQRISAGASGAIFGMFGMFMAVMLLEREMDWKEKKGMVLNMVWVIGFNLLFGLQSGIDNAAHTGGLLLGIGYGSVLLLRSDRYITHSYSAVGNIVTVLVIGAAFVGMAFQVPASQAKYLTTLERFGEREQVAMAVMQDIKGADVKADEARFTGPLEQGIALWDESIVELEELQDLPEHEAKEVDILLNYARLRKKSFEMLLQDIQSNEPWLNTEQQQVLLTIGSYVEELKSLRQAKGDAEE